MCHECCREFKGWCKAFTKTETALAILEGVLLIICIAFLTFLIIHFIVCQDKLPDDLKPTEAPVTETPSSTPATAPTCDFEHSGAPGCTWEPFKKTEATTHYYLNKPNEDDDSTKVLTTTEAHILVPGWRPASNATPVDNMAMDDQSDGEDSDDEYRESVLALVKMMPPHGVTFGCILSIVSEYWAVTSASCIESIEEVDSLDNFVMLEEYGMAGAGSAGRARAVSDVRVHPLYQGRNRSYDAAALRSDAAMRARPLALPTMLDYYSTTLGERLHILGFGPFRSSGSGASGHVLRSVEVYTVPAAQCAAAAEDEDVDAGWSWRHLARGRAEAQGSCGAAPLCAGVRYSRGTSCNYCAGTPLLRARRALLLGLMSDARNCAVACEPALYVNLATIRDWLDMVLESD